MTSKTVVRGWKTAGKPTDGGAGTKRRGKSTHVVTTAGHTDAQLMRSASLPLFTFFRQITSITPLSMHHRPVFDFETNTSLFKGKNLKLLGIFLLM
jgi:hypothetical protein